MFNKIDAPTLKKTLEEGRDLLLLDVREPQELEEDKITSYPIVHIPLGEIMDRSEELPQERDIIVICRSGGRSGQACNYLMSKGFRVTNLEGGMLDWRKNFTDEPTMGT